MHSIHKNKYELTDHLGNVRATFTEGEDNIGKAKIVNYTDYYPFGWEVPNRIGRENNYRFAYQGQFAEKDQETGFTQFEARLFDSRIGRWMSPDKAKQFSSPYIGMGNNPIIGVDPDGRIVFFIQGEARGSGPVALGVTAGVSVGVAFDLHGNIGIYHLYSGGMHAGIGGAYVGISGGAIFSAPTINDIKGWGFNIGAAAVGGKFIGIPIDGSVEINIPFVIEGCTGYAESITEAFKELFYGEMKGGHIGASIGTPASFGLYVGGYADLSYTTFDIQGNIKDMINKVYVELDKHINLQNSGITLDSFTKYINNIVGNNYSVEAGSLIIGPIEGFDY